MRGALCRALSPATAIAVAAFIVAAGGTSFAVAMLPHNSVGTAQLRSHAVTTPKLATSASARIAGLIYRHTTVTAAPMTAGVVDVKCPSGLTAIAGGVETEHTMNAFVLDSHPTKSGWEASAANSSDTAPEPITAYAVCAKVEGGAARSSLARDATVRRLPLRRP